MHSASAQPTRDYFIGNFFGNAVLPSLLHEDRATFRRQRESDYADSVGAGSSFWCRRDNGGWGRTGPTLVATLLEPDCARILPASERNVKDTLTDGLTVTIEGMPGAELIEFWPDIVRSHQRKQAEKLARQQAAQDQQASPARNRSRPKVSA